MDNERFGAFVAERRRALGLTQKELARRLHLTDKAVSKWERGLGFPDIAVLEPLAGELEVAVTELLQGRRQQQADAGRAELQTVVADALRLSQEEILLRRRRHQRALWATAALGLLLPLAINIVDVLIEGNINVLMSHPMQLMVPFALVLAEQTRGCDAWEKLARVGAGAAAVVLCWLCTVTAYASYRTVALAYEYVDTLSTAILTRVFNSTDYTSDTRVLIAGLPDESEAQKFNFLFDKSAYTKNMVFWDGRAGVLGNWKHYLYDYHGVWIGEVDTDEYYDIIDSEAFKEMPVYPAEGSLEKFDDILVVKLEENPPR